MNVLLSIKPEWVSLMTQGRKSVELKSSFSRKPVKRVFVYESRPVQKIRNWFKPTRIVFASPKELWPQVKDRACVPKPWYDAYYASKPVAIGVFFSYLVEMSKPVSLDEISIKTAPQNFIYLSDEQAEYLLRKF